MKKKLLKISLITLLAALSSCGSGDKTTSENVEKEALDTVEEKCIYSYNNENTNVSWVAFKTTKKIGVGGEFLNFTIEGTQEGESPLDVVKGASISIPVNSVETKDEGRNKKIVDFFFGTFTDTETLTGIVKEVLEDGSGVLSLTMNGIENDIPVKFDIEGANLNISTTIDLNNWDGQAAIDKLNKECEGLHKGEDGITKLWPDVEIKITTELKTVCE